MEHSKIVNFKRNYPDKEFPSFRSLDESEVRRIRQCLAAQLGLSTIDPLTLVTEVDRRQEQLKGYDAERGNLCLSSILSHLNITPQKHVYLNWYRYDKVDEMAFADIDAYFDDIWYPGPDDLDIFDSSCNWILTITHDGFTKFLKWATREEKGTG